MHSYKVLYVFGAHLLQIQAIASAIHLNSSGDHGALFLQLGAGLSPVMPASPPPFYLIGTLTAMPEKVLTHGRLLSQLVVP